MNESTESLMRRPMTVGEVAVRSGVAVSTIHYYESLGLITSWRNHANHRRYPREVLRRVALVKVAQRLGISLASIAGALDALPKARTPTKRDWEELSARWRDDLDRRIERLTQMRNHLTGCIGCGCLSMDSCPLYNPDDQLAEEGSGPRLLDPD